MVEFSITVNELSAMMSKAVKRVLASMLEIADDTHIVASNEARFNAVATCRKGDVVLFKLHDEGDAHGYIAIKQDKFNCMLLWRA